MVDPTTTPGTAPGRITGVPAVVNVPHATTVHITVLNGDFIFVYGHVLPLFGSEGLSAQFNLEAVSSVSLNPIAAKQLMHAITRAITQFEEATHSVIPDIGSFEEQAGPLSRSE
jgi:hypothetical protein